MIPHRSRVGPQHQEESHVLRDLVDLGSWLPDEQQHAAVYQGGPPRMRRGCGSRVSCSACARVENWTKLEIAPHDLWKLHAPPRSNKAPNGPRSRKSSPKLLRKKWKNRPKNHQLPLTRCRAPPPSRGPATATGSLQQVSSRRSPRRWPRRRPAAA